MAIKTIISSDSELEPLLDSESYTSKIKLPLSFLM